MTSSTAEPVQRAGLTGRSRPAEPHVDVIVAVGARYGRSRRHRDGADSPLLRASLRKRAPGSASEPFRTSATRSWSRLRSQRDPRRSAQSWRWHSRQRSTRIPGRLPVGGRDHPAAAAGSPARRDGLRMDLRLLARSGLRERAAAADAVLRPPRGRTGERLLGPRDHAHHRSGPRRFHLCVRAREDVRDQRLGHVIGAGLRRVRLPDLHDHHVAAAPSVTHCGRRGVVPHRAGTVHRTAVPRNARRTSTSSPPRSSGCGSSTPSTTQ